MCRYRKRVRLYRKDHGMRWRALGLLRMGPCPAGLCSLGPQDGADKCVAQKGLFTRGSYLVDVFGMADLGTLGGEVDIQCGVFLAVEREEQK